MNDLMQTPKERLDIIKQRDEEVGSDFMVIAEQLHYMKESKRFMALGKGYLKFGDFLSQQAKIGKTIANKLIAIWQGFILEFGESVEDCEKIGFQKLCILLPLLKHLDQNSMETWRTLAMTLDADALKMKVDEELGKHKPAETVFDIAVRDWQEKWCAVLNCNKKELLFQMAMYMMFANIEDVRELVNKNYAVFEQQLQPPQVEE